MDNTKAGLAAVEVGPLRGKVTKDIYLEGFWLGGLQGMDTLLDGNPAGIGTDRDFTHDLYFRLNQTMESLNSQWWNMDGNYFVFGMTAQGKHAEMIGNWPSVMVMMGGGEDGEQTAAEAVHLASPDLATDWGTRWLSSRDPLYDPISYNNGTVWPFVNAFVVRALQRGGATVAAFSTLRNVAALTGIQSPGQMPEHMNGDIFRSGERSVPHQLFSSVGVLVPIVRDLFGLVAIDANHVRVAPQLSADWQHAKFSNFAHLGGRLSGEFSQQPNELTITLECSGSEPLSVELNPALPAGAHVRRVLVDGKPVMVAPIVYVGDSAHALLRMQVRNRITVVIEHEGGIGIVPPAAAPQPGDRTSSLKIIRVEHDAEKTPREMNLTLAGLGGRTYTLDLVTTVPNLTAEGAAVKKTENGYRLEISFEGPENDYVTRQIRLRW
jgi:hypothetical protein